MQEIEKAADMGYHDPNCPFGCNSNGKLVNPETGKLENCPHCSQKRNELVKKGRIESDKTVVRIEDLLHIVNNHYSDQFVYDAIIPKSERVFLDQGSVDYQEQKSTELYNNLVLGELPTSSYCFGLGIKGRFDRFIYPMMIKAYKAGLTVARFVTSYELTRLLLNQDPIVDSFIYSDIMFIFLNTGSLLSDVNNTQGILEARGALGKPTIIVTTWRIEHCNGLLTYIESKEHEEEDILIKARPVFVKYSGAKYNNYTASILDEPGSGAPIGSMNGNIGDPNDVMDHRLDEPEGVSIFDLG